MPNRKPASIQDVAAAAQVSTATVSRVLNNPNLVAKATAERVQKAIADLGYRPNLFAQGLMTSRSHVIGIALPDIHGEFYSELLRGADAEARKLGYHLLVSALHAENGAAGSGGGWGLAFGLIDGLALMITEPNEALLKDVRSQNIPLVVLDTDMHETGVDSVVVDNTTGMTEAMEHLIKRVPPDHCYFVGGPRENFDTQTLAAIFIKTLGFKNGGESKVRPDHTAYGHYSTEWGEEWAKGMIKSGRLKGAGVVAANDEIAYGVMLAAQEAGLRVPEDVKIVGFDDTRLARLTRPRLSTVRIPLTEVGAAAIRALVRRLDDPDSAPAYVRLATTLVVRESSV